MKIQMNPIKAGLSSTLLVFGVCALAAWNLFIKAEQALTNQVREHLADASYEAAAAINGELHAALVDPKQENTELYTTTLAPLKQRKLGSPSFKYMYTCVLRNDSVFFVLDPTPEGDADSDGIEDHTALLSHYEKPSPALIKALRTGQPQQDKQPETDEWGTFMSGFSPIIIPPGGLPAVVGIDMDVKEYIRRLNKVRHGFQSSLLLGLLLSLAMGYFAYHIRKVLEIKMHDLVLAKEKADSGARAKDQFLATMSHELRTPLNGILGMSLLLRETTLNSEQTEYVDTLSQSGEGLLTLLNDILDLSKIEAGRLACEEIPVDLKKLSEAVINLFSPKANEKGIRLLFKWDSQMPIKLLGDPGRLRQILLNLVGNALKFTDKGYALISIKKISEIRFRLEVQDTGIGIPFNDQHKLFQSFSQADPSTTRKFGGTGLGLAISRKLVELMGGQIGVISEADKGCTFWLELPLMRAVDSVMPSKVLLQEKLALNSEIRTRKIIVLDNSPVSGALLCETLSELGFNAEKVLDRMQMMERMIEQALPPLAIFVTAGLGVLTEQSIVNDIRSLRVMKKVPLIFITYLAVRGDALRVREMGFDGFFTLPLQTEWIPKILEALHSRSFEHHENAELITKHNLGEIEDRNAQIETKETLTNTIPKNRERLEQFDKPLTIPGEQPFPQILLVEDNKVNQLVAMKFLKSFDLSSDLAENGLQAVEKCKTRQYLAILMDCQMPEMDGYEATGAIRKQALCPTTPIIAMTANALEGDRQRCLASGMDDYITKPFRPDALKLMLEKHIGPWTKMPPSLTLDEYGRA